MTKLIQAVRGMNDMLPQQAPAWQFLEKLLRQLSSQYGYQEIRFPIVEKTQLFKRSVGEVTDIVEKEMYSFEDRNGDSLSLRPEGTACCVRAALENGLLYRQSQRLWYLGAMFRHERPQKGRYRQFHQFSVEAFGMAAPEIDAEIILMMERLWQQLGLKPFLELQLNSIGDHQARQAYRQALVDYLMPLEKQLDEDCQRRLHSNPLRILDSKNAEVQKLLRLAPQLVDFLSSESQQHFQALRDLLDQAGIRYRCCPSLVRGLDYYTDTVFEWVTDKLGAQATVCAGGRYNTLVEQLGGNPTPAIGCSLGLERLLSLLEELSLEAVSTEMMPDIYVIITADASAQALSLIELWRSQVPELNIVMNGEGGSLKSQFKRADKSGAKIALIIAQEELQQRQVAVKYLREERSQGQLSWDDVVEYLQGLVIKTN